MRAVEAGDRVGAVLARDERLLDVFVAFSPVFEKLRNPAMRKTMARLVTIEQAARIAGVAARSARRAPQRRALGSGSAGDDGARGVLSAARDSGRVDELARGSGHRLRRARRLARRHRAVPAHPRSGAGAAGRKRTARACDLRTGAAVCGARSARTSRMRPNASPPTTGACGSIVTTRLPSARRRSRRRLDDADVIVLDVRGLEPPEPMVRTLEALAVMPRGKTLVQINVRVPQFLLPEALESAALSTRSANKARPRSLVHPSPRN